MELKAAHRGRLFSNHQGAHGVLLPPEQEPAHVHSFPLPQAIPNMMPQGSTGLAKNV